MAPALLILTFAQVSIMASKQEPLSTAPASNEFCSNEPLKETHLMSPLVPCNFLDAQWVECEDVAQLKKKNHTNGLFCPYFGTKKGPLVYINVTCSALPCIECSGLRTFKRTMPCMKFTMHYFLTALLYSIFFGVLAVDRFYLGYSAIAVSKLMTLGGLGLWWIVDIYLLINGNLMPADESEWQPHF